MKQDKNRKGSNIDIKICRTSRFVGCGASERMFLFTRANLKIYLRMSLFGSQNILRTISASPSSISVCVSVEEPCKCFKNSSELDAQLRILKPPAACMTWTFEVTSIASTSVASLSMK